MAVWPFSVGDTIIIITTISGAIVAVSNGIRTKIIGKQQDTIEHKVDTVHDLTNSRLSKIEGELAHSREEVKQLTAILKMTEATRVKLAEEAALAMATTTAAAVGATAAATLPMKPGEG